MEIEVLVPSWKGLKSHAIDGTRVHRFRYAPARWEFLTHDEGAPNKIRKAPWLKWLAIPYVISGTVKCFLLSWRGGFSVLHVHWPFPHGLIGMISAGLLKIPLILTFHGAELVLARHSFLARKVIEWSLRRCALATANSTYTKDLVEAIHPVGAEVLPYGAPFADRPGETRKEEKKCFRILFVGRHIERKGVPHLLEATRHFPAHIDWELVIVGSGDQTGRWKAQAAGLGDRIRFTGKVDAEALQRLYASADVFVLPAIVDSRGDTEGLGVVLLEAIEAGVPVVASRVGGIVDVIRHEETGLLVAPGEPSLLAREIFRIHSDPELARALTARAKTHARKFFNWDSLIDRWVTLYRSFTDNRP